MYGSGPGKADLHGAQLSGPKRLGLAYSSLSLTQRQSTSLETLNHHTFSSISLLGTLGPGDRRLCMRLALHDDVHYETLHDRPFSVTSSGVGTTAAGAALASPLFGASSR